ncbi:MAG: Cation-transporting ATPase A, P type (ATPase, E1-E2 type) [candidate division WWE3 bacterium GW2011_GWA1_46_21]|uniref:Cation-transporting ATPase A, P type (ATPase, E1-E2 type) n=2 Tax=Katanobacteria TaxID=422282 RepID=A0A0G1PD75_UNCKA|nr:MAG: Cation-transporting ATPase A, P type (ATPase, E1-E2 type) [candidate division WWE3 bacterium GW2011_GWA1_46_21]
MSAQGLSAQEARTLLAQFGPNSLPEKRQQSDASIFLSQLKNPLVYVLIAAAFVTFIFQSKTDTLVIFVAILLNTVLGFVQERKAGRALDALKKMLQPIATVVRDGIQVGIAAREVVPGDWVVLNQGDRICADGRAVKANRLHISEAILTGESVPVQKLVDDMLYMGTIVVSGNGAMLVEKVGAQAQMGKIAGEVQSISQETPLKKQLARFSKQLSVLVLALTLFVFLAGLALGKEPVEMFTTAVALAVAAIPEGLLVGLTVILAIGMQRILKQKGLVRNLVSAETLGDVTTICTDKTGTLTLGEMRVVDVIGDEMAIAKQVLIANDRDDPIVVAAWEWANEKLEDTRQILEGHWQIDSIPFSSAHRVFVSLNRLTDHQRVFYLNGAPEELLARSTVTQAEREFLHQKIEELSSQGKRLLGLAQKVVPHSVDKADYRLVEKDLAWVGLLAFSDPVRPDVKAALVKARDAGIKLAVITGDYSRTAIFVMRQLGLRVEQSHIMLGKEIEHLSVGELAARLKGLVGTMLFARTSPDQKLKIVSALKLNNEVVAMTGDGVNDAPALAKADIGIVVGEATEVAKESADLILLDSSFSTIVAAIEEGRGIFDNIRKVLLYLMSDAFQIIVAVFLSLILKYPLPVSAAQVLWINLVSDGFPDLALTVDPKRKGLMLAPPRSPKEPLFTNWMRWMIFMVSLIGGMAGFLLFVYVYKTTGNAELARSATFAVLGINTLFYVFSIRTLTEPVWKSNVFANKWLIFAVFVGFVLQMSPFVFESLQTLFGIEPLGGLWYYVIGISGMMFVLVELGKWVSRERFDKVG